MKKSGERGNTNNWRWEVSGIASGSMSSFALAGESGSNPFFDFTYRMLNHQFVREEEFRPDHG